MDNRLRESLAARRFTITVEVVPPSRGVALDDALAAAMTLARGIAGDDRIAGLSVTDRVLGDDDHDPVTAAVLLARESGKSPLVHLSGKDRTPSQTTRSLEELASAGLENVLCVTGDRLKAMPSDRRVPFLESVHAIALARRALPSALIGAAISPFKYTEEETHNQYFKMARKHAAGADFLVTQVGWDPRKLAELMMYRRWHALGQPVLVNLMPLPTGAARRLHTGSVPGVVVSDDLLALVEAAAATPDKGRAARLSRLALQIVGAERLGYAGVQLSGLSCSTDVARVLDLAEEWRQRAPAAADWWQAWSEWTRLPSGRPARLQREPGYFVFDPTTGRPTARARISQRLRRRALEAVHDIVFDFESPIARLLRPLARRVASGSGVAARLVRLERWLKRPLVGCEVCGRCRLPDTFYVCPETCPKGLANGPCGGSRDNICEAGDRECVHSLIYRLAIAAGRARQLQGGLVAAAPEPRGGSSWLRHFAEAHSTLRRTAR